MAAQYCTFWYPTIYHQNLVCLCPPGKIVSDEISDKGKKKYHLSILIDSAENLIVTSEMADGSFVVKLKPTTVRRNGFIQYEFDVDSIPDGHFEDFKKVLGKDVYHLAKQFYHSHEADSGKDGALRAIVTEAPEPVDIENNRFLLGFLENYTPVFMGYAKELSFLNSEVQKRERLVGYLETFIEQNPTHPQISEYNRTAKKHREDIVSFSLDINRQCENALIEYTYSKTLWSSKYNQSFLHEKITTDETQNNHRRQALNIRNSIRYIENIKYKNQNRLNRLTKHLLDDMKATAERIDLVLWHNRKTEKINSLVTWFSVFLAIVFGTLVFVYKENDLFNKGMIIWAIVFAVGIIIFAGLYLYRLKKA
jgi:hypothetical protein